MGRASGRKGDVSRLFVLTYFSVRFQFLEHCLPDAGNILSHGKFYGLFLGGDREFRQPFLYLSLRCLQLKITNMAKWPIVGWNVLNLFKELHVSVGSYLCEYRYC